MSSPSRSLDELAEIADTAAKTASAIPQFTLSQPLTVEDAYEVQRRSIQRRLDRGERRVGLKMGLTSKAKMLQVGVDEVIWGRLTDAMFVEEGSTVHLDRYVHVRAEPEIAFLIDKPLSGPVTAAQAMAAVGGVAAAAELIDSRFENFKFALPDVVADNSSSSGFVLGNWHAPSTAIDNLGISLEVDGRPVHMGSSAAILGDPVRSLVAASRVAAEAGEQLEPGWIVLAGGATAAVPLQAGYAVRVVIEQLGAVTFDVAG